MYPSLWCRGTLVVPALLVILTGGPPRAVGQDVPASELDELLVEARQKNPEIRAADEAVIAARNRATAAGVLPDPRLAVGLTNALVSDPLSSRDMMTMRMVQLGLRLPYPGKLGHEREEAEWLLAAAESERRAVELRVIGAVKRAYYEIWLLDRSIEVVRSNHDLLQDFVAVTQARYGVGTGGQQDLLKAQVERTRLGDEVVALERRRAAAVADLNALLDRPDDLPVVGASLPTVLASAALPPPGTEVRFSVVTQGEGGRSSGPVPDLVTLQSAAKAHNPLLRALDARAAAQAASSELADLAAFPDFDVMVGYGQRGGREDMVALMVSVPLPLFKGRKQDRLAAAADADLASVVAERAALANDIRAEVSALHASLVRTRERLALSRDGVLPQARASFESAVAGYPVAQVDFLTLLDNQVTLLRDQLDYYRLLADFGRDLAMLEQATGGEVLR